MLKNNWIIFDNIDKLSECLANEILVIAKRSIKLSKKFSIVLAGGTSVVNLYKILRRSQADWNQWHVYIGDERCLPIKNKDRNDYLINKIWLNDGLIPKQNINFIHAELGMNKGATHYNKILKNIGDFDVVLLSIGDDGHTASLFPDHLYDKDKDVVVEGNSPKYPKNRISLSYSRLNRSKNVFKVVSGISKRSAIDLWLNNVTLPINKVTGQLEKVYISKEVL